jgi:hypothetical protein
MKRTYYKPTMKVVALQQHEYLLADSSGMRGEISGYSQSGGGFSQDDEE